MYNIQTDLTSEEMQDHATILNKAFFYQYDIMSLSPYDTQTMHHKHNMIPLSPPRKGVITDTQK